MSQSATLYRISNADFAGLKENATGFVLAENSRSEETFENTCEGLRFVLSKKQDVRAVDTIEQIFSPSLSLEETNDYASLDFDLPDENDLLADPLCYTEPVVVKEISSLLENITVADFQQKFDPDELNNREVYPYGVWNTETSPDIAYNVTYMTQEFLRLKEFFHLAKEAEDYVFVQIG